MFKYLFKSIFVVAIFNLAYFPSGKSFTNVALAEKAVTLEPNCEKVLRAGEERAKRSNWQSITEIKPDNKMEILKYEGQLYLRVKEGKWTAISENFEGTEKKLAEKVRSGEIKLLHCQSEHIKKIDGVETEEISYTVELPKSPPVQTKIFIGTKDSLPYMQTSKTTLARTRYSDIEVPK